MSLEEIFRGLLIQAARLVGGKLVLPQQGKPRRMFSPNGLKYCCFLISFLLLFVLLLGAASPASAAEKFCSEAPYNGVIDGNVLATAPVQITIDMSCTFQNWPRTKPLTTTINFQTNDPSIYLIIFDNVWYDGNMACSNIDHKLWVVNSEEGSFSGSCQDIMIPTESIFKLAPATSAAIGVPFTYTLTLPAMTSPYPIVGGPSSNDIGTVVIWDNLSALKDALGVATNVDLTFDSISAHWKNSGTAVTLVPEDNPASSCGVWTAKNLCYKPVPLITADEQLIVEITVVLSNNAVNVAGKTFVNTVKWWFSRWIDLDEDGIEDFPEEFFNPLPGEAGVSQPMSIGEPYLVVNKTASTPAVNVGDVATFTINVQNAKSSQALNAGTSDAWNATITDKLPAGMCINDPTATVTAKITAADGTTLVKTLTAGVDYTVTYGSCNLTLTMTDAGGPIAPNNRLIITYQAQIDPLGSPDFPTDGDPLTNVAAATKWFTASSAHASGRRQYDKILTDGSPAITDDFQDSLTLMAAMHGYYFTKTVVNRSSLQDPATTAAPGDTLRYTLRVFNVDETINTITITDQLDTNVFDPATFSIVSINTGTTAYTAGYDPSVTTTGLLTVYGAPILNVDVHGELTIVFDITLRPGLANGTLVSNQATLTAIDFTTTSDDPNLNGLASPDVDGDEDPTIVTIQTPGALLKANTQSTAAIGERFEYTITVPAVATTVPLYDVKIVDTLPANVRFVSARVVSGGAWLLSSSVTGSVLTIQDAVSGIDILANRQARIAITVELLNSAANQSSVFFNNTASYTYNRANGVSSTQLTGGSGVTPNMNVVEPLLAAAKTFSFVSPSSKPATDPATVGDIIEYRLTISNSGTSIAFDTNVVDVLPSNVALVAGSAAATINGVPVSAFVVDPSMPFGSTVVWGRENGDGNLDIPAGQSLVLTYQVTVVDASSLSSFTNSAYVDWTSLEGDYPIDPVDNPVPGRERTGAGCPTTFLPNDYCTGPVSVTVNTVDNTSIVKSVNADSYPETPASTTDPVVRVGDTVTYDLTLNLQEYTTRNVVVEDLLPAGMALQSFTILGGPNFSYTLGVQPAAGATGTLRWEFGDIINTPSNNNTPIDPLVIRYVAKVVTDAPPAGVGYTTSILLENQAKLFYTGGDPAVYPARLTTRQTVDVRQPQMSAISKVDLGTGRTGTGTQADPYHVNIASDVMQFRLNSCNNGLAPAYNVRITDVLANELNETGITPVVSVGGTTLTAGTGYTYTAPAARGGSMIFVLSTPVNPGQCVTIDYNIVFHSDVAPNQTWHNSVTLNEYWSLPAAGRMYDASAASAQIWMTNQIVVQPVTKSLTSASEATIGETVTYRITVPGTAMNASLDNVLATDTLHNALAYVSATATLNGSPLTISTIQSGQTLTWGLGAIPAGQQAVITLTTRVANNDQANAGTSIVNAASYTYTNIPAGSVTTGTSSPLTIVEPSVTILKTVSPTAPPSAGDTLHYTVTLTAASGANFSGVFDAGLVDTLSLGLAYIAGTARVGGVAGEPAVAGDGITTPQTLTWTGNIDIAEGAIVPVTYDVRVLATVVPGQTLTNSATAQWTCLDGVDAYERTGSGTPAYNDYFISPATTSLTVSDNNSLTKAIITDTYVDAPSTADDKIVRIGDIVTYRLTLKLGEGTNRSVSVQDVLPTGMAYDSLVGITPASGSSTFTYAVLSQPAPDATGTLTWDLGDVVNTPSGDNTPFDALNIEYRARVLPDAGIAQAPTSNLINTATLGYLDAGGNPVVDPVRLVSSDTLVLRQPVMSTIVKLGNGATNTAATPLNVNVATGTVHFQLRSCNTSGLAPAYSVTLSDMLASQLDEGSITPPVVAVGGTTLTAGTGYTYTPPAARGGSMLFLLNTPVNPGQCATVDYDIGFHTDFGPNQIWSNSASLNEYWSLPAAGGQQYAPAGSSQFYMTNTVSVTPLAMSLVSPVSPAEATIGQEAVYRITVPGTAVSAALDSVEVSDTLHAAFEYVSATATLNGAPLTIGTLQSGQTLTWNVGTIPAGQQAVITLTVRVANNSNANAGTSVTNTASYTYTGIPGGSVTTGTSGPLTLVEPSVNISKTVINVTHPGAAPVGGDILRYTVNLTAASGANFSGAFDAGLVDTLSLGLAYQAGTSTVNGTGNTITDPAVTGDGSTTPQTLTWDLAGSTADIDIAEGTTVRITYDVQVLDTVVAGQVLTNSVTAQWTGLDGANSYERTGADGIGGLNDYVAMAAAQPLTVPVPSLTLQKTVDKAVANPGDRLRYTITIQNTTTVRVANFSLVDEIDHLNATPMFQPGSISIVSVPTGSATINGGTLAVTGLNIGTNETLTIVFEAVLATSLKSGTVVLNQAGLQGPWPTPVISDDPNLSGAANPTRTVIPANGVVYDPVSRRPLGGVTLTMQLASTGTALPGSCFIDPSQQNQVTDTDGTYKFDLLFDPANCPEGADYVIAVTSAPAGYVAGQSLAILPDSATAAYSVPACSADAIPATTQCEAQVSTTAPTGAVTTYYLRLTLDSTANQIFNNHIPVDPYIEEKISITKTSALINVTRGQLVPYTIRVSNTVRSTLPPLDIVDTMPPGFKYVEGSSRVDEAPIEPVVAGNGRTLRWNNFTIGYDKPHTIKLLLVAGAGVSEGEYVNVAQVVNAGTDTPLAEDTATVRIIPDPAFDCTDVIGKVFDDRNLNGIQDSGESGLAGVRVATARGLIATTDEHGRFHITCAIVPDEDRGSNFILKLDERSLPTGYRVTTENPRVQRATSGKMLRFNFGATIHHVVSMDVADGAFEPQSTKLRMQWQPRIDLLLQELRKAPSVLRLSYLADVEEEGLAVKRLEALKKEITGKWDNAYPLTIETELFWRRGSQTDHASANGADTAVSSGTTTAQAVPPTAGAGITREAATCGETTEMHLPKDEAFTPWILDPAIFAQDQGDRTEMRQVAQKDVKTIKLTNLVPPIRFRQGEADIPGEYITLLRGVLEKMRGRANVRLHFVGHADSKPLSGALQAKYGDNTGLSRERAGTTAEYCQRALGLPPEAISYEGVGDSQPVADNATEAGRGLNRRVEVEVWYDEIGEKLVNKEVIVSQQVNRVKVCRTETVCKLRYKEGHSHRTRVKNLIAPLHYQDNMVTVPDDFVQQIRQVLTNLRGKQNIVVKFTAYTDNTPLQGRDERIYGDHGGLSKAVARRVSLAVQDSLKLSAGMVESYGRGASQQAAPNDTPQGRAMNRRVEVEFWHDDPLQDLPDEPQLCPEDAGAETVTRVYDPPSGGIAPILFENGKPVLPDGYIGRLRTLMDEVKDKANVRLRFIGYTSNERLDRRTASVYGDDIGWSTARARRAMSAVSEELGLTGKQTEFEGRGYVQSADVVNAGFTASDTSRVEVQIIYDELVALDSYEGVDVTRMTREVNTMNPFRLNLMRISVDGKPIDDPGKSIPDVQRCTDVALDHAQIEFKYDNLKSEPRLNVTAWPPSIRYQDVAETEFAENLVRFRLYANYHTFIKRAEVRIFDKDQSVRDTPVAVIPMNSEGLAEWRPAFGNFTKPGRELSYLVRVYDEKGNFDETVPQPLWIVDQIDSAVAGSDPRTELLAGYGESRIATRNIQLNGGIIQVHGSEIPAGHSVWLAGYPVPVDRQGRFVAEEILPKGMHTVEVAVLDPSGSGELFLRDLPLKKNDWFTVGIADLTLARNKTDGPAQLLAPDKDRYRDDFDMEGRLAFYSKGQFGNGWGLTASADTREGQLNESFSNFLDKRPEALFRRIDPDYHFPTFGDDSTVMEDAPTSGKLYVKLKKDENYGLWGNFKVGYLDNDLAHVDRGLYGGNLHYQMPDTTSFGEKRFMVDGFAAQPGTVAGRDEFRGTGGSLYYLRRQDVLQGSERVRIEIRDKDSGIVLAVKDLQPVLDYDVDYLQGRLLLTQPLASTADDALLVHSDSTGGNPVYLVVRYEYTPGVEDLDAKSFGGRAHYWLSDYVKVGVTTSRDPDEGDDKSLDGADVTIRKSANTWVKLETGRSKGPGVVGTEQLMDYCRQKRLTPEECEAERSGLTTSTSLDGGFILSTASSFRSAEEVEASANRVDISVGFQDFVETWRGKITLYNQKLEAGYSAPGLITDRDTSRIGGTADLPIGERLGLHLKADKRTVDQGLQTQAAELDVNYRMNDHWTLSSGVRQDSREDRSLVVLPTQETGDRRDVVGKALYDPKGRWTGYGFAQKTVEATGSREDNDRFGIGGGYRVTDRFKLNGEVSDGDLGAAGRLGTEYLYTDRTTLYLNYALENERSDNGLQARKGSMTSGFKTRYSDSASVYMEERYTHGDVPTGLVHATGVELAPADRVNLGANLEFGTLEDNRTGAEIKRTAAGVSAGYGFEKLKITTAFEYRVDDSQQLDASTIKRTTWLTRNTLRYELSPDWRLIGKLNYSQSESSQGQFYDGGYTEAVMGYAYRPVDNDRLNALFKYTYFTNTPAAEQVSGTGTLANALQRSHVGAVDVMYDLTTRWTVGGKYAYRLGEVSVDRVNPQYFESRASLYIVRADWHFVHRWDFLMEGRLLDLPDAGDRRSGALVGIYRRLGNHIKFGVGYNFSEFSDDLTQLDYKHQGVFINIIGTM